MLKLWQERKSCLDIWYFTSRALGCHKQMVINTFLLTIDLLLFNQRVTPQLVAKKTNWRGNATKKNKSVNVSAFAKARETR